MSPQKEKTMSPIDSFPRVSGDEPVSLYGGPPIQMFSPRERG